MLCLQLEYRFGDPRDIEFAVGADNVIYVLQVCSFYMCVCSIKLFIT